MSSQFDRGDLGVLPKTWSSKRLESTPETERLMIGNGRVLFEADKLNDESLPPSLSRLG